MELDCLDITLASAGWSKFFDLARRTDEAREFTIDPEASRPQDRDAVASLTVVLDPPHV
jgi:hypothetical protein